MSERKKSKKRREEYPDPHAKDESDKPAKEEYQLAKWMKNNIPTKKTKFLNHNVQYFTGSKAVDAIMASYWGTPVKEGQEAFFTSRASCVDYLDVMLRHKFYHRAKKVPICEELLKAVKKGKKEPVKSENKEKKDKEGKEKEKSDEVAESSHAEGRALETSENEEERKKKKKKVRLEMHLDQIFADNLDAYVWIYDPIPFHYWIFGALVVLAGIGICLFPLWPPTVRNGVYYLSVAAACFLVFIIALALLRCIVFCLIWILTLGAHHLWIFPNLTEDVGFFASFWPLYHYEYKGGESSSSTKKRKKKKEKLSDNEDEPDNTTQTRGDSEKDKLIDKDDKDCEQATELNGSGSESEGSSQQSQTGKDFEIVDKSEVVEDVGA